MASMCRRFWFCCAVVLALGAVCLARLAHCEEQKAIAPTVDDLFSIWKERSKQAATAQFKMHSFTHKSPKSLEEAEPNQPLPKGGLNFDDPNERLVIADDRFRYDSTIASLVGAKGPHTVTLFSAFNGKWQQRYSLEPDRPANQQSGTRKALKECDEWGQLGLSPLILAVRPLRPEAFGENRQALKIDAEPVVIEDRPTWRVTLELSKDPPYRHEFYLEQKPPYRTLCFLGMRETQCVTRVDIEYPAEASDQWPDWIPKTWSDAWFAGTEARSLVSRTVDVVILNGDVPDKVFDLQFPAGMLVVEADERGKEQRRWRSAGAGKLVPVK